MGGSVTDRGEKMNAEMHTGFCWGTLEERDQPMRRWENNIKVVLKQRIVALTNLAQVRDKWRDLENTVMNSRFP